MYDLDATIINRRSVRGFLRDKPVARKTLVEILELAQSAPSNCNVQPWRVFVATGSQCETLQDKLTGEFDKGNFGNPEDPIDSFSSEYRSLQIECAVELYGAMGVARDDKEGRLRALRRNFEFFDAPHIMVVCMEKSFGVGVALDVGMYLQTLMLGLESRGISSCAQASLRHYPDLVRKTLGISDHLRILCGLSFGYENPEDAANECRQRRRGIEANVTFVE